MAIPNQPPNEMAKTRHVVLFLWIFLGLLFVPLTYPAQEIELPEQTEDSGHSVRVLLIPRIETVLSGELSARIEQMTVDIGDMFKQGEKLVLLNCTNYEAELEKSLAQQREAEKNLEVHNRLEQLGSSSILEAAVAEAHLDQARAEVAMKEHQVSRCSIKAPFSGRVVKRLASPFQYITPGQPVLEILDNRNIDIQIHIPSQWIRKIRPNTPFIVFIDEVAKQYQGAVTTFGSRIDPVSQTLEIRGTITGKHPELLAGMSGTARFELQ